MSNTTVTTYTPIINELSTRYPTEVVTYEDYKQLERQKAELERQLSEAGLLASKLYDTKAELVEALDTQHA